jgi:hypothetical protein
MNRKKKQRIDYPNITSAIRSVPDGEDLPVLEPSEEYNLNSEMEERRHGENRTSLRRTYRSRLLKSSI